MFAGRSCDENVGDDSAVVCACGRSSLCLEGDLLCAQVEVLAST